MANIASQEGGRSGSSSLWSTLLSFLRSPFKGRESDPTLRESLEDFIEEHDDGLAEDMREEERSMLRNILNFGELRVEDVIVPRADIDAVEESTPMGALLDIFSQAGHSRLPVFRESLDDPIGMVHIKDVIGLLTPKNGSGASFDVEGAPISKIRRDILFVPPSMPVVDLFLKMQATRVHMALVIDEYGGTDGLVTIEDIVEEIVGEIEDEHDIDESPQIRSLQDGTFSVDARFAVEEAEKVLDAKLMPEDLEDDIDTLGGLIVSLVERVPQRGELISHPSGLDFEVTDADPRRIKRLRISIGPKDTPSQTPTTGKPEGTGDQGPQ